MLTINRPLIRTSPLYGSAPVESMMFTSRKSILDSSLVPKILYSVGCKLSANSTASMASMLRGRPLCLETPASAFVAQGTAGSSRAGDMLSLSYARNCIRYVFGQVLLMSDYNQMKRNLWISTAMLMRYIYLQVLYLSLECISAIGPSSEDRMSLFGC
jgi:hypothetical protein